MHTNGDLATENAITAVKYVQEQHYRPDHRHRLEHNQLVSESQLQLMSDLDIYTDLFANHINVFGDYHLEVAFGADRANRLDPVASALKYKIKKPVFIVMVQLQLLGLYLVYRMLYSDKLPVE